jgi:cytochrome b involved in lipid metabolism
MLCCQHNKDGDCWVVIDKKVYDVSKFLDDHPVSLILIPPPEVVAQQA